MKTWRNPYGGDDWRRIWDMIEKTDTITVAVRLLDRMSRDRLITLLEWNDHNGAYSDEDAMAEGLDPLTKDELIDLVIRQAKDIGW